VKEFWKSVNTWQSWDIKFSGTFFRTWRITPDQAKYLKSELSGYVEHVYLQAGCPSYQSTSGINILKGKGRNLHTQPFYDHYTGEPVLAGTPPVKNWRIL